MSEQERITVGKEQAAQWPEQIKVSLLIPRDIYIWLFEAAVNQEPQLPVVHQIMRLLQQAQEQPDPALQQQLAENERRLQQKLHEALDSSLALLQEDEQTMGEMRALLQEFHNANPGDTDGPGDDLTCRYCDAEMDLDGFAEGEIITGPIGYKHRPDCFWLRVHAFLAAHPAPESGGLEADDE